MSDKIIGTLDPGHGGNDRWNVGPTGYVEADGVLDIAKRVKTKLEATGRFEIHLTRDHDMSLGLTERARIAANNHSQFFISEHSDGVDNPTAGGTTIFYSIDLPGDKGTAEEFAAGISGYLGVRNRGAQYRESTNYPGEDYYTVIDSSQDLGIPHVFLIEQAFHSNPKEEALLKDPAKRDGIAEVQAKVICKMFGVPYSTAPAAPVQPKPAAPAPAASAPNADTLYVQKIMNRLKIRDFEGKALAEDGFWGKRTESAVKKFQEIAGIVIDGQVGPQTKAAMNAILAKPVTKQGATGIAVRYLQFRVGALVDGSFGPMTAKSVATWQSNNGLGADAVVGPITWSKLIG